tara:strand:+ start:12845 stop:13909 length:1065 start_codon:yes stop_codon:yes gene_type:complete
MPNKKISIGVVFGGASGEHNVSINSAKTVIKGLTIGNNKNSFNPIPIYIDVEGRWWDSKVAIKALNEGKQLKDNDLPLQKNIPKGFKSLPSCSDEVDIWYPVLHGPNGEDGSIQGLFKLIGKPFVGSNVLGSSTGMDKLAMKAAFSAAGLPQVRYESAETRQIKSINLLEILLKRLEERIGYPCFIKPANLGSSVGISKAHNRKQLIEGLELASEFDDRIVIEENIYARELECAVLGKKELRTSLIGEVQHDSDWYDYQTKYSSKGSNPLIPAPLGKDIANKIQKLSLDACKAISAEGIARVDFFYDEKNNEILINEINTLPGFTNQSMFPMLWAASGLNLEKLVAEIVKTATE